MDEGPEREASARLAQHLAVAVQIAEAVIRLRQQQTDRKAASTEQAAAALRAETTAQHTADRVVFSQALDPHWTATAELPVADVAARRVEDRLSTMAPASMARFAQLRESGVDRIEAMRDVLATVAAESGHSRRVFVGEPGQSAAGANAQARADTAANDARGWQGRPDDVATPLVDEHAEGVDAATPRRAEHASWQANADAFAAGPATERQISYLHVLVDKRPDNVAWQGPTTLEEISQLSRAQASVYIESLGGGPRLWRTTENGSAHPADLAGEHVPRPYTHVTPAPVTKAGGTAGVATKAKTHILSRIGDPS